MCTLGMKLIVGALFCLNVWGVSDVPAADESAVAEANETPKVRRHIGGVELPEDWQRVRIRDFEVKYMPPRLAELEINKILSPLNDAGKAGQAQCWFDSNTGKLLVKGNGVAIAMTEAFLNAMDKESLKEAHALRAETTPSGRFRIYRLKHVPAETISARLNELFRGANRSEGDAEFKCSPEVETNAIIVAAPAKTHATIEQLLLNLDRPARIRRPAIDNASAMSARFRLDVYELVIDSDDFVRLDAQELAETTKSAAGFAAALAEYGRVKPLYRFDQGVSLASVSRLKCESHVPFLRSVFVGKTGERKPAGVEYQGVGCDVHIDVPKSRVPLHEARVNVRIEIAGLFPSDVLISDDVPAPITFKHVQSHSCRVTGGRPVAVLSIAPGAEGKTMTAHISRIVFDDVK